VSDNQPLSQPASKRLDSWKEIASHFQRDVRTVQRWEKEEGLPVHRKVHSRLASIYAYESELDAWWSQGHSGALSDAAQMQDPQRVMLAVLPLTNLSGDPEQEYFSDGLTEEFIAQLSRLDPGRLGVIARHTAMKYKGSTKGISQIARELGVKYLLDGTVRRALGRARITVALIQVPEQTNLWTKSYDRDLSDLLTLETEVARSISDEIAVKVSMAERARLGRVVRIDPDAHNSYLLGRYFWNRRTADGIKRAMRHFQETIERDPGYAPAHAGLADCYALLASVRLGMVAPNEAMPKSKAAAQQAIELDPMLAEAHASLGYAALWYDWDWPGAERSLKRALELDPTYAPALQWNSYYLETVGRLDESVAGIKRALELDPLSLRLRTTLGSLLYFERQYDLVIEESREALAMDPNFVLAYFNLGRAYSQKGMHREAIADLKVARELSRESPAMTMQLGYAYAMAGKKDDAKQMLNSLARLARKTYVPAFYSGAIYTGLGDKEQAFRWLRRAYLERCDYMVHLPKEPATDPLLSDPRFAALVPRPGVSPDAGSSRPQSEKKSEPKE
jgi:TolB-like protein/Flp pilus assembly protein TadD